MQRYEKTRRLSVLATILSLSLALAIVAPSHAAFAPAAPTYDLSWTTRDAPAHMAIDVLGNVYVACYGNNRIQKYDPFGNLLLEWGTPGTGNGQFNGPWGIALDASGNVYVSDYGNHRIQKFTYAGAFISQWGSFGAGNGQLSGPTGIAFDAVGNIYVVEYGGARVQKFNAAGAYLTKWGLFGSAPGEFREPDGILVSAGRVYIADGLNQRIQSFDLNGNFLGQFGSEGTGNGQFLFPLDITGDALGNLYVTEWNGNRIQKFTSAGAHLATWGSPVSVGPFSNPAGIAIFGTNLYVADNGSDRIERFNLAGEPFTHAMPQLIQQYLPTDVGAPTNFNAVGGIAVDATGNIWVSDLATDWVHKFSPTGTCLLSKFGNNSNQVGFFDGPNGLDTDADGNLYMAERNNNRVSKFGSNGGWLASWGSSGSGPGQFSFPIDVAVDGNSVYVADNGNSRIQKFTTSGVFVLSWTVPGGVTNIETDPEGHVYALGSSTIVYAGDGTEIRRFQPLSGFGGIAIDRNGFLYNYDIFAKTVSKYTNTGTRVGTLGPTVGTHPFQDSAVLTCDDGGNLYIADHFFVRKLVDPPAITSIVDIGNDEGRSVRLSFRNTSAEVPSSGVTVLGYGVYRRIEPLPASENRAAPSRMASLPPGADPASVQVAGWDFVGYLGAFGAGSYDITVPTLANTNSSSTYYSNYFVQAKTTSSLVHFESSNQSGYSMDNLAPPAVTPFTGKWTPPNTRLHWGVSTAPDFAHFNLYRGDLVDFFPSPANRVATTTDTGYVDPGPSGANYKLTAVDLEGNEGPWVALTGGQTTDVPGGAPPIMFALDGVHPSPTRASRLDVHFSLPNAAPARLEMFDVSGRRVAARDVNGLGAGAHVVNLSPSLNGILRPGLYFLRLSQGAEDRRVRVTIVD